jgi:hypothetical protein
MSNRHLLAHLHAEAESLRRERGRPMEAHLLNAAARIAQIAREISPGLESACTEKPSCAQRVSLRARRGFKSHSYAFWRDRCCDNPDISLTGLARLAWFLCSCVCANDGTETGLRPKVMG